MPKLGQIFYGRGKDGYGILGASPSGRPFAEDVAELCRAVGSPDRPGDIRPFLLGKRVGGNAVMLRACRGEGDPTGRSTLFFHAIIGPIDDLASAGLDAFVLAKNGLFLAELPKQIEDIKVPSETVRSKTVSSDELRFPAFIASDHPLDAEVRRSLGDESLTRNWTTYSYRPLDGFDLCVHSSYAPSPATGNRYMFDGGRIVALESGTGGPNRAIPAKPDMSAASSGILKVSLAANIVLAVLLIVLWMRSDSERKPEPRPVHVPDPVATEPTKPDSFEMTKDEAWAKWGSEWKTEFEKTAKKNFGRTLRAELNACFENEGAVRLAGSFDEIAIARIPFFKQVLKQPANEPARQFYTACKIYAEFAEQRIFNQQPSN